jgi:acyl carrier protein
MDHWDPAFDSVLRPHLKRLDPDERITPQLDLRSTGLDSLGLVELLVAVEDTFGVEFPDELLTAHTFRTPATLWAAVANLRTEVTSENG